MDSREIQPRLGGNGRNADSGQIKAEIDHTRERIDDTLDALADKLHPKHLLDEVVDYLRNPRQLSGTAGRLGQAVWRQVQEHPMPSLLIGAGLAWMLSERNERTHRSGTWASSELGAPPHDEESSFSQSASHMAQSVKEKTGAMAHSVKEKAGAMAHNVKEKTGELTQSAREKTGELAQTVREKSGELAHAIREKSGELAHSIKEKSMEQTTRFKEATSHMSTHTRERASAALHRAEDKLSEATNNYPLAVGLGFLAVGVLAGLALPRTHMEDETFGRRADQLKDKVRDQGQQALESAQRAAAAVAHVASEEAEKQGLTPQNLGEKIKHVASDVARAATEAAQREGLDKDSLSGQVKTVASEAKRAAQDELGKAKERIV